MHYFFTIMLLAATVAGACAEEPVDVSKKTVVALTDKSVDFAHEILPLLKARCSKCHTAGTYKGGFSMDTRATLLSAKVVAPGDAAKSELIARVTSTDPDERMPPTGDRLSGEQVALLSRWINQDVPWQDGFSFARQKIATVPVMLKRPELPPAQPGRERPIDRFVGAYFAQNNVPFPPMVDDVAFARRVHLDLIGLLPTTDQLDQFLADPAPDKRERLIDKLLGNNTAYADHWLTFWSDLLRNDYTGTGYIDGGRKAITKWLYSSLWENKPYNQFVRELISPSADSEGFIKGFKWRGTVSAAQSVELQFAQNVGQVFLGVNLKCASCHDSFIDDWKLTDSWGLAAIASNHELEIYRCDVPTGKMAEATFLFPELGNIDASAPREQRLAQLAKLITDPRNGRFSRTVVNRIWQRMLGRGIVNPVDAMDGAPWSQELLDYLACQFTDDGYDLKKLLREIATSQIYQARCVEPVAEPSPSGKGQGEGTVNLWRADTPRPNPLPQGEREKILPIAHSEMKSNATIFCGPVAKRMTAEQFIDCIWRITDTSPEKSDATDPKKPDATFEHRGQEPVRAALMKCDLLMRSLGRPNRDQVVTTRPEELSTLEALDLTNGPAMAALISKGAAQWRSEHPHQTGDETIDSLYRAMLCRTPTADERTTARQILGDPMTDDSVADMLWTMFMLPEFQIIK